MKFLSDLWRRNPSACAALVIGVFIAIRLAIVIAAPVEIGPDESQYWRWSEKLDFGYYSKPPLIAWMIAASTAVFGDGEWAIRFFAPILHGVAAFFLFLLGKKAFDARIGAWSAAIYLLMPGITLSSTIMSTDAVLLPGYAMALYFLWRFRDEPKMLNAILAGGAIGLAMLGKYSASFLYAGAVLAAIVDRDMRKAILSPAGAVAALASLVVLAPNLWWNAANNFATISHTADNANIAEAGFNPLNVFNYIVDQSAVFGPILLLLMLAGFALIVGRKDKWTTSRELWLLCFIAPPFFVIMGQEILSRAHANWAAVAYPGASVLVAAWIDRAIGRIRTGPIIRGGVALNAVVGLVFTLAWAFPTLADSLGASAGMKGVRGWEETAEKVVARAKEVGASAIMLDDRELWHAVDYYGRNLDMPPIRAWQRGPTPRSHAEEAGKMMEGDDRKLLIASISPGLRMMLRDDFAKIEPIGYVDVKLTPKRDRRLKLYLASGYHQHERTPEFEKQHQNTWED